MYVVIHPTYRWLELYIRYLVMKRDVLRMINHYNEQKKVRKVVKDASNGFFHHMKSVGAEYLGSDSETRSRFMCFEYGGKVLEVDMRVLDMEEVSI
jgi:hypothetical protein